MADWAKKALIDYQLLLDVSSILAAHQSNNTISNADHAILDRFVGVVAAKKQALVDRHSYDKTATGGGNAIFC